MDVRIYIYIYIHIYIYIIYIYINSYVIFLGGTNFSKQLTTPAIIPTSSHFPLHDAAADGHPTGAVLQFTG